MKMKRSYPGSRNTTIIAVSLSLRDKCFGAAVPAGRQEGGQQQQAEKNDGHKAHAKGPNEIQVRAG